MALSVARMLLLRAYRRGAKSADEATTWVWRYTLGSVLSGLARGSAPPGVVAPESGS